MHFCGLVMSPQPSRRISQSTPLAHGLGATALGSLRVASIVTELARNLVIYTDGGRIILEPHSGPPPSLAIIAADTGPGIPHLDQVLAGTYRGKTGLSKGLLGVK